MLLSRGVKLVEVTVAENPFQAAVFRCPLPETVEALEALVIKWTNETNSNVRPTGCFVSKTDNDDSA